MNEKESNLPVLQLINSAATSLLVSVGPRALVAQYHSDICGQKTSTVSPIAGMTAAEELFYGTRGVGAAGCVVPGLLIEIDLPAGSSLSLSLGKTTGWLACSRVWYFCFNSLAQSSKFRILSVTFTIVPDFRSIVAILPCLPLAPVVSIWLMATKCDMSSGLRVFGRRIDWCALA